MDPRDRDTARRRISSSNPSGCSVNNTVAAAAPRGNKSRRFKNKYASSNIGRRGKSISRAVEMLKKLGNLRVVDVLLFFGVFAKLISIYSRYRQAESSSRSQPMTHKSHKDHIMSPARHTPEDHLNHVSFEHRLMFEEDRLITLSSDEKSSSEPQSQHEQQEAPIKNSTGGYWRLPKWLIRSKSKMVFNRPLLYRRGNDDFRFVVDPNIDDDVTYTEQSNLKIKGYFDNESYEYRAAYKKVGYAVVDDTIYNAENKRMSTSSALASSGIRVNRQSNLANAFSKIKISPTAQPAFGLSNDRLLWGRVLSLCNRPSDSLNFSCLSREAHLHFDDTSEYDHYFAFDDDHLRGTVGRGLVSEDDEYDEGYKEEETDNAVCKRPAWYRNYYPTCNELHARVSDTAWLTPNSDTRHWIKTKDVARSKISKYLGSGYYRDAFLYQASFVDDDSNQVREEVVFKQMKHMYPKEDFYDDVKEKKDSEKESEQEDPTRFELDMNDLYTFTYYLDDMRKDSMVMELLTSSPRSTNIYGHCGMSSLTEFLPEDIEATVLPTFGYSPKRLLRGSLGQDFDSELNDHLSPREKLEIALEISKCLAAMHGFEGGVIAHVDLQWPQFFRGKDGFIKLIDYNRAEPLLYDPEGEEYCRFRNGKPGDGQYRAPEEIRDHPLTEKIDVFALGNLFFALLTGRIVWEDYDFEEKHERIKWGEQQEIPEIYHNDHGFLVQAIHLCWTYKVDERPDIFQVVAFLEDALESSSSSPENRETLADTLESSSSSSSED